MFIVNASTREKPDFVDSELVATPDGRVSRYDAKAICNYDVAVILYTIGPQNQSLRFPTKRDSAQPPQLQKFRL